MWGWCWPSLRRRGRVGWQEPPGWRPDQSFRQNETDCWQICWFWWWWHLPLQRFEETFSFLLSTPLPLSPLSPHLHLIPSYMFTIFNRAPQMFFHVNVQFTIKALFHLNQSSWFVFKEWERVRRISWEWKESFNQLGEKKASAGVWVGSRLLLVTNPICRNL